ncbi:MAG: enoyl-CoA hydratase/isomerase family protein [Micromonosporaceae bacterium]|nr:enoyl-CoA hydratase/isomerase family protein [Micromonosporaceae bacterium]
MDLDVLAGLERAADLAEADDAIRCILVHGSGHHFSAGGDITTAVTMDLERDARAWITEFQRTFMRIAALRQPSVAAIEGYALGGGLEFALWCDIRIVSTSARLGVPEVKMGAIPAAGGTQLLPRLLGRGPAMALLLTGDPIDGRRAYELGLATQLVEEGEALDAARRVAEHLATLAPLALAGAKKAVQAVWLPLAEAMETERRIAAELFATRDRREGMTAFLERRTPRFAGT